MLVESVCIIAEVTQGIIYWYVTWIAVLILDGVNDKRCNLLWVLQLYIWRLTLI